jgi:hypothetical protein
VQLASGSHSAPPGQATGRWLAERETFDNIAQNIAEVIDDVPTTLLDHQRRLELIRHHVRRALQLGFAAGRRGRAPDVVAAEAAP